MCEYSRVASKECVLRKWTKDENLGDEQWVFVSDLNFGSGSQLRLRGTGIFLDPSVCQDPGTRGTSRRSKKDDGLTIAPWTGVQV